MSRSRKKRFTPVSLRADGKHHGETPSGPLFTRVARIFDRLRCSSRQRVEPTETPKTAARPDKPSAAPGGSSSAAATLRIVLQSVREGFAAHRCYQELRSQGVPHHTAIRQALDVPEVHQDGPQGGDPANHPTAKELHK